MSTYIIAEAGVNHNGSLEMAKALAKVAKEAGADAVKYQTFRAENLVTIDAKQADYQVDNLGVATSQYEMLKQLELKKEEFLDLMHYCKSINIEFLTTPFDCDTLKFVVEVLKVPKIKVSSGDLTNYPFLYQVGQYRLPVIVSTGMAGQREIDLALMILGYSLLHPSEHLNLDKAKSLFEAGEMSSIFKEYITILQCTTAYPTKPEEIHLNVIDKFKVDYHDCTIGFSDHSVGILASLAAVSKGAKVIEKHFTLSKQLDGPDHVASLNEKELKQLVKNIRKLERMFGNKEKQILETEISVSQVATKSLVAATDIQVGDIFTNKNISIKRPGTGMNPIHYWDIMGKKSRSCYKKDELLDEKL